MTVWFDAFKMGVWFLLREYLTIGKNTSQPEKRSAGFQLDLSFLRDSTDLEKKGAQAGHRHAKMSDPEDEIGIS